jgi:hypothetical protein
MLTSAATMSPVRQPGRVDLTAVSGDDGVCTPLQKVLDVAAARHALERDLKTLMDQFNYSGSGATVVPSESPEIVITRD